MSEDYISTKQLTRQKLGLDTPEKLEAYHAKMDADYNKTSAAGFVRGAGGLSDLFSTTEYKPLNIGGGEGIDTSYYQLNADGTKNVKTENPWYQNGETLSGMAQLGGLAMQLAGYSDRKKQMEVQTASLQQNLAQAKTDSAFKAATRSNLNAPMAINTNKTVTG